MKKEIVIQYNDIGLRGHINFDDDSRCWIIFAHGSGSSRLSSRNNWVADRLNEMGFATILFDLLTEDEDLNYKNRFDISLLAERLLIATNWLMKSEYYRGQPLAYFGASTGAGAALTAAAHHSPFVPLFTVISRGGRPDLAGINDLKNVKVPVLLIVGDKDHQVIDLNQLAMNNLADAKLVLIPGATHLFEEPGTLDEVVKVIGEWLETKLPARSSDGLFI
ncbi:dienelactone hydrolase family protein [Peredibacter starrii]|uniref:Dienelactone hydrolase family protein n=1 Tax=Peredibacter starrii TaxID=28202 RepID=A0AAX4HU30_9BACT|nr:dienelactone hydrolase family protein [Peredibacter starrii]WPU66695.1 dienelactone hydrolase family protein [Peredibacter starrii]